jgi:hypothetical protein
MCFSVGCLIAIVFVVDVYDGERIPELISGLTVNAIISVLSTASRASLVFVVSATMGQLKWYWLRKSGRHIHDIQAMDDASRGPLGALSVLVFWTGGSLAALGSIITLLMISFGPFLQQLVEYPSRNMTQPGAFALAPRNLAYTHHLPPSGPRGERTSNYLVYLGRDFGQLQNPSTESRRVPPVIVRGPNSSPLDGAASARTACNQLLSTIAGSKISSRTRITSLNIVC